MAPDGDQKLAKLAEVFDTRVRGPRTHTKGEPHAAGALRAQSNRGLAPTLQTKMTNKGHTTDATQVSALWDEFLTNKFVLVDWATVGMATAVNYDAKYMYSRTFNHVLANDGAWAVK